ncbi:PQQ-binding-like beta-propeller repeat protein [bacterium]|nr:PQQ-binding-like beta-propeller repeat protein [bacterium]
MHTPISLRNWLLSASIFALTATSGFALGTETSAKDTAAADSASPPSAAASQPPAEADDPGKEAAVFKPHLLWTNARSALLFPIQWMAASNQGTLLAGSLFSKTFYLYNIYNGTCKARQTLPAPTAQPPLINGQTAIFYDTSTSLSVFDSETGELNWERLPLRLPQRRNNLRQPLPRPRGSKVKPLMFNDRIATINTDGLVMFYPNRAPSEGSMPDFLMLQTSPDEKGSFTNSPIISRQVLYVCTAAGHLHFANLNNIGEIGMIKNLVANPETTIAKEVRVPILAASPYIYLATMDGTIYCYREFRKFTGQRFTPPTLVWQKKLSSQCEYQSNRWGRPVIMPQTDSTNTVLYVNAKDCAQALDAYTGETLWEHRVPQGIASPPILWSDYVIIISEPKGSIPAKIVALSPTDGHTVAFCELPGVPSCEPLLWDNYLVLGYRNGYAECYSLTDDID